MCQECPLLSAWEAEYVWEDVYFLGRQVGIRETALQQRGLKLCPGSGGGKAGQKQSCTWEVMCEFLCLAGKRSRTCEERAGSLEERGFCKAQQREKAAWE